jgi:flagellar motor protein MotB
MDGQIIRQSSTYRRGVVLGLTMAEIMLLLIFCLLLVIAAFLRAEQQKVQVREEQFRSEEFAFRKEQEDFRRRQMQSGRDPDVQRPIEQPPGLRELLEAAPPSSDTAAVSEYWRELVEGRNVVTQAKRDGISPEQLKDAAGELGRLQTQGISPSKALHDAQTIGHIPSDQLPGVLQRGLSQAQAANKPGHQWPPIITLSEAEGNYFKSGSAELSTKFRNDLNGPILSRILDLAKMYDVDIIEVVGHTDEQPVGAHQSNLDRDLLPVLTGSTNVATIVAGDNAGLGLARAVSVVSVLRRQQPLAPYRILPLSGGQLIDTNQTLATSGLPADILQRRRIEIRLRKSEPTSVTARPIGPAPAPKPPPRQKPTPASPPPRPAPAMPWSFWQPR